MVTKKDIPAVAPPLLGSSDIVPIVLRETREFLPTEAEWHAKNDLQITRSTVTSSLDNLLFEVPNNNILFITSAFLSARKITASGFVEIVTTNAAGQDIFQLVGLSLDVGQNSSISLTFPMPIKVENSFTIRSKLENLSGRYSAGFSGWLESKRNP